jgi:hypothetical protein
LGQNEFKSVGAEDLAMDMQKLHCEIKEQLHDNNKKYNDRVDQCRRDIQFEVGDQVLTHLMKDRFPRGTYNKIKMKNIGPRTILRNFAANAYEIELIDNVGISLIFNFPDLYPYK